MIVLDVLSHESPMGYKGQCMRLFLTEQGYQKGFGVDKRMVFKKVLQHRNEGFGIRKAFVLIWRVGFLSNYDIRMGIQKFFVIKADIPDNAKPICNDAELKGTTEMSIDIHLLDVRIGSGVGRHGS